MPSFDEYLLNTYHALDPGDTEMKMIWYLLWDHNVVGEKYVEMKGIHCDSLGSTSEHKLKDVSSYSWDGQRGKHSYNHHLNQDVENIPIHI